MAAAAHVSGAGGREGLVKGWIEHCGVGEMSGLRYLVLRGMSGVYYTAESLI